MESKFYVKGYKSTGDESCRADWFMMTGALLGLSSGLGSVPDSKVHGANMGPTWVLSAPDGPHVGPMNFAIRGVLCSKKSCVIGNWCNMIHYNKVQYTVWCSTIITQSIFKILPIDTPIGLTSWYHQWILVFHDVHSICSMWGRVDCFLASDFSGTPTAIHSIWVQVVNHLLLMPCFILPIQGRLTKCSPKDCDITSSTRETNRTL